MHAELLTEAGLRYHTSVRPLSTACGIRHALVAGALTWHTGPGSVEVKIYSYCMQYMHIQCPNGHTLRASQTGDTRIHVGP